MIRLVLLVRLALLVLLAGVLVFGGTAVRVWQVARQDHRPKADAIVVLGASQYDGRPSEVFRARLDHAADLYSSDVAPRIVTVGGNREGDRFTEASSGRRYLREQAGVPASDVYEVPVGNDTVSSLRAAAELLDSHQWRSVVLVTDPWHSLRSRAIARDAGLEAQTSPVRDGPASRGRGRELRYILRESAAYLYFRVFGS